jgi:polar amino acid transport system substrate-binding protein
MPAVVAGERGRMMGRLLGMAVALSLALSTPAHAIELNGCIIDFEPWGFLRDQGIVGVEPVGVMFDMVSEFERRSNFKVTRKLLPYARVELELELGRCDFALMAWADARSSYANKGTVFLPLEFGVVAVRGNPLKNYDDLKRLHISVARGLKLAPTFDADAGLRKSIDRDNLTGVKKAIAGRVNAVGGSVATIRLLIAKLGAADHFGDVLVLRQNQFALSFSKKSPKLEHEAEVNRVFASMVADDTVRKTYAKWFAE